MVSPQNHLPSDLPTPRQIYLAGCREIAKALSADGFAYASSGPKLTCKEGEFTFQVSFQSSRYNVPGVLVQLWIHATVRSKALTTWRVDQPYALRSGDIVAGGQIGNLLPTASWLEWNLANPAHRVATIADAVATIRRIALPYFARFRDVPGLCEQLLSSEVPSLDWSLPIEFLLCFAGRSQAEIYLHRLLSAKPNLLVRYHRELADFRRNGLPAAIRADLASELAYTTLAYDLAPPANV